MVEIEIELFENEENAVYSPINKIEEIHAKNISYNEFFRNFMVKNVPIVITGICDQWECMNWTNQIRDNVSNINFSYLEEKIDASLNVPIANCSKVYFNSHEKSEMKFSEFLTYWKGRNDKNDVENKLLYLKDWHLRREQQNYTFYKTPIYFASDWLNEYCESTKSDDYRFVYMGPNGTW